MFVHSTFSRNFGFCFDIVLHLSYFFHFKVSKDFNFIQVVDLFIKLHKIFDAPFHNHLQQVMSGFTAFVYRFSNDESKLTAKSLLCKHVFNSIWQQSNRPIFVDLKWSRSFPIWMPNDTYFFFLRIDITWMIESNFSCKYFWFEAVKVSCKFRSLNIFLNKNIYIFWKLILSLEKLNIVLTGKNRFLFNYNLNRRLLYISHDFIHGNLRSDSEMWQNLQNSIYTTRKNVWEMKKRKKTTAAMKWLKCFIVVWVFWRIATGW